MVMAVQGGRHLYTERRSPALHRSIVLPGEPHELGSVASLGSYIAEHSVAQRLSAARVVAPMRALASAADQVISQMPGVDGAECQEVIASGKRFVAEGTLCSRLSRALGDRPLPCLKTSAQRRSWLIDALGALFERHGGPLFNVSHIALRTGSIVLLSTFAREVIGDELQVAWEGVDPTESARAWASVAALMLGPALSLLGALRDENRGTATWQSQLSRIALCSMAMGATLAAYLTGGLNGLFVGAMKVNIYSLLRETMNAFAPLRDDAPVATLESTSAAALSYAVVQAAVAEVAALLPMSSGGRSPSDYAANLLQGSLNALGIVIDDTCEVFCRYFLTPAAMPESPVALSPEDMSTGVLKVRAGLICPDAERCAGQLLTNTASRITAFQTLVAALGAAGAMLTSEHLANDTGQVGISDETRGHILNGLLGVVLLLIYVPFVFSGYQRHNRWDIPPEPMRL